LGGTARRTKGELVFKGVSAAVTIALHTFHVTRAFLAWQTGTLKSECAERSLQIFSQSNRMRAVIRVTRTKTSLRPVKIQNSFTRYIKTGNARLYFNKHPKIQNTLHRRGKRVFREKEKTVKMTLIRVLAVLAVMALGSTTVLADGIPAPMCLPSANCVTN
jgi:hypothetical protein